MKKERISKKKDFDNVFKNGKSVKGRFLILKFAKNNLSSNRTAFIISKKISSKAVVRNKIRRRIQESVRLFKKEAGGGFDAIFIALPKIREKNFFEIKNEAQALLAKIS